MRWITRQAFHNFVSFLFMDIHSGSTIGRALPFHLTISVALITYCLSSVSVHLMAQARSIMKSNISLPLKRTFTYHRSNVILGYSPVSWLLNDVKYSSTGSPVNIKSCSTACYTTREAAHDTTHNTTRDSLCQIDETLLIQFYKCITFAHLHADLWQHKCSIILFNILQYQTAINGYW